MIRAFEAAKVIPHPRFRALSEGAQALYLAALRDANVLGWIARPALLRLALAHGRGGLGELWDAGLAWAEQGDAGAWLHLPQTLDRAAALGDVWDDVAARTRAHWSRVTAEVIDAAPPGLPQAEWDAGWDALAVRASGEPL